MRALQKQLKKQICVLLVGCLVVSSTVIAATDFEARENLAKARVKNLQKTDDHESHENHRDESQIFRGVFFGYLPCSDCDGVKVTLSLKQKNNYLLVTQYARQSTREYYEKGKYQWDEATKTVLLTPRKNDANKKRYHIEDAGTLIQLNEDGSRLIGDTDRYTLKRSDMVKSREVHIH